MKKAFTIAVMLFWLIVLGIVVLGVIKGPEVKPVRTPTTSTAGGISVVA